MPRWVTGYPYSVFQENTEFSSKYICMDSAGGPVVKNPPASAGGTGSIPGPGRSPVSRGN